MPYIDFGGGSNQTPVKETEQSNNCDNCIHRYNINDDLFYCTVYGNLEFYNAKHSATCFFKKYNARQRTIIIAIHTIKEDGSFVWTGYTSIFSANGEKLDNDVIKLFYEKAVPDICTKQPKLKDKTIVPIIIGESIEHKPFEPVGDMLPNYILKDIIKTFNDNIDNIKGLTDE